MSSPAARDVSQPEPAGNTNTAGSGPVKKTIPHQLYRWAWTIKLESIDLSQLSQLLTLYCKSWVFQLEQGEDSAYKHWQGCCSLKRKERFCTVKNLFPIATHLEPCKDWWASKAYCSKTDTRLEGPYTEKTLIVKTIEVLRPWQQYIKEKLLEEPDDRTILWIWDSTGATGKTQFTKYMAVKHGAQALNNGKTSDLAYAIGMTSIVMVNLCRSLEGKVNYQALESIKDGLIFSPKYESCTKIFNSPHLAIFANFEPDRAAMSEDRWEIINIEQLAL